jgi:hypothetical protein
VRFYIIHILNYIPKSACPIFSAPAFSHQPKEKNQGGGIQVAGNIFIIDLNINWKRVKRYI